VPDHPAVPEPPPAEPPPAEPPPAEPPAEAGNPGAAFLPIGIVFLVVGLSWLANDSMRGAAFAFLPVGVTFLVLSMRSANSGTADEAVEGPDDGPVVDDGPVAGDGPDVTPR